MLCQILGKSRVDSWALKGLLHPNFGVHVHIHVYIYI